ncbi:MAG: HypC/HybG/HupF family hydrogenase formation chaperone [Caldiserica bacterium]|nr:MAG: HypC/HybG/HupF family hydrogenase formation chaperone [Caldisericota bacterium]
MCLGVPLKIFKKEGQWAIVKDRGIERKINISFTPQVKEGDYVIVHAGFSISILKKDEAEEVLKIYDEIKKNY